jgi:hypothetical protein
LLNSNLNIILRLDRVFHFSQFFEQILQAIFHLGQTKKTEDPTAAIEIFLKREFPQLLNCQEEPHEAFLVPDSFIHGGIAAKVML